MSNKQEQREGGETAGGREIQKHVTLKDDGQCTYFFDGCVKRKEAHRVDAAKLLIITTLPL